MDQERIKKGTEAAKEMAEHIERLAANVLTKDTTEHFAKAVTEIVRAVNSTVEGMKVPDETKRHLIRAEREMILAMRDFLDAVLEEITRIESGSKEPKELKKIDIKE